MKRVRSVGIWGDSILKGVVFDEENNKYCTCEENAVAIVSRQHSELQIKNFSRFGSTAPKGERKLRYCIENGFLPDAAVLEFGGNDCDFKWSDVSADCGSEHFPHTSPEEFADCLRRMIRYLRDFKIQPFLMSLPPISADRYFDWFCKAENVDPVNVLHWLTEKQLIYRTQEKYSHMVVNLAREENVPLIDVRAPLLELKDYSNYLCIDGIHPNERCHRLMADTALKFISSYSDRA